MGTRDVLRATEHIDFDINIAFLLMSKYANANDYSLRVIAI